MMELDANICNAETSYLVTNSHPQHTYLYTWRKEKKGKRKRKNITKQNKKTYKLQTLEQEKN
jgi:hypothetical protein